MKNLLENASYTSTIGWQPQQVVPEVHHNIIKVLDLLLSNSFLGTIQFVEIEILRL